MRLQLVVVGLVLAAATALLPVTAMAALQAAPQRVIFNSDSQMAWTSCGTNCVQGIDATDAISATLRDGGLVLGESLADADSKSILETKSVVLSQAAASYGGQAAVSWVAKELKVWERSPVPFQASNQFNHDRFTFLGWAGDGSLALSVHIG